MIIIVNEISENNVSLDFISRGEIKIVNVEFEIEADQYCILTNKSVCEILETLKSFELLQRYIKIYFGASLRAIKFALIHHIVHDIDVFEGSHNEIILKTRENVNMSLKCFKSKDANNSALRNTLMINKIRG